MRVLVNTSPLIALSRIKRINLLRDLYQQVVCPQSVVDEIEAGVQKGHAPAMAWPPWVTVDPGPLISDCRLLTADCCLPPRTI
jgi:predicted nucleic acid-binding protein